MRVHSNRKFDTAAKEKFNHAHVDKETAFIYLKRNIEMKTPRIALPLSALLISCILLVDGCQVYDAGADFFHARYINTVAYFNTFYNAQRAFGDAEQQVIAAQQAQQAKPGTAGPLVSSDAKTKFNFAIEKASKLLTFYPTSKWVDDALLMIGKSYYYLEDDVRAERKFVELLAKFPDSDLRFETALWYGRSLLRQKRFDEGVQCLDTLYAAAVRHNDKTVAGLASAAIGKYYYGNKSFEKALPYFERSLEISPDDAVNAETELLVGYSYRGMGEIEKSLKAFVKVDDYSPEYATSFTAELEHTRALSDLHQFDEALSQLFDLLDDAKNAENFSKIQLQIGLIYVAQHKLDEAIAKFTLLDTSYAKTEEAAAGYFNLAKIYEVDRGDYPKARLNYDKARSESPTAPTVAEAGKKSEAFAKYFTLRTDLANCDSLIISIGVRKVKRDSARAAVVSDTVLTLKTDSLASVDSVRAEKEKQLEANERQSIDSLQRVMVKTRFELAGIFYLELDRQDSATFWFNRVIEEGGKSEYAQRSLFTLAEISRTSGTKEKPYVDSLYSAVIALFPGSPYAQESRRILGLPLLAATRDTAEELYLRAEILMDGARADSALPYLYKIVKENKTSPYSPKALYAIGWVYENRLYERDSASAVYRRLLAAYPGTQFALAVRPKVQEEDAARKEAEQKAKDDLAAKKKKEDDEQKKKEEEKSPKKEPGSVSQQPSEKKEKP